ncbi:LysE family translocator [Phreatobacter aquaticus]|uniref:LysE family translocator n=1 Tax=Phreatobacter aquaticus TaxID=2570229 RepID=A0A4D7QM67_9HYPH|nr:LysE family translocator [Phreatobacter aquaticus]QCK85322.1 LysE family translocator [Phreatobacter aquaticus]
MNPADTLLALAGLWLIAVLTPGPNMILFTAVGLSSPTRSMVASAIAILLGTLCWGFAGLFGLFWLFELFPAAALAVKLVGGAYLAWMGLKIMRQNISPPAETRRVEAEALGPRRAFFTGLATALGNPKSLVFVSSLFAVTHLAEQPLAIGLAGVGIMVAMSTLYYGVFGLALRKLPIARSPGPVGRALGIGTGAIMVAYGGKMIWER